MKKPTETQARYLSFIYFYTMVLTLEANGFIERTPGQARTIRVLLPREEIPDLE